MTRQSILFFADRLPPLTGGMEMHARYFIKYFTNHSQFELSEVITKNKEGKDCLLSDRDQRYFNIENLCKIFEPACVFFNSGRWIEELEQIREMFPKATFFYRTGGNEILKASLIREQIPDHSLRQSYWVRNLNNLIDFLITNSAHTEMRLRKVGVKCRFVRCIGGVNTSALKSSELPTRGPPTFFCAARFVPYKNHALLLAVIHQLLLRGNEFRIRLAGDGPLFAQIKEQARKQGLNSVINFLGVLDNEETCREIASANIYIQLSSDHVIEVPGGSYVHSEGMGRSILEALTAGTFVVAGHSGALPEVVTPDRGLLVDPNNLEQITIILENLLKHLPIRKKLSNDFCWTKIFKIYEELFDHVNENITDHRKMQSQ